ncbi:hypothetical protein [Actinoplanes aureus]|uniref:Uncharacterized protein n=1 Tax=Actinoplanes aureus TaxID=2792083 RepID=A0A931C8B1_9ACTN|nr:hypothetical protein [Actinoplanes aureus]MBG0562791.1 hypothetical protein [Actinoplanes aureus]
MNRAEAMPVDGSRSTTATPGEGAPPGASGEAGRPLNPQVTAGGGGLPAPIRPPAPGPDGRTRDLEVRSGPDGRTHDLEVRSREVDRPGRRRQPPTRRLVGL